LTTFQEILAGLPGRHPAPGRDLARGVAGWCLDRSAHHWTDPLRCHLLAQFEHRRRMCRRISWVIPRTLGNGLAYLIYERVRDG